MTIMKFPVVGIESEKDIDKIEELIRENKFFAQFEQVNIVHIRCTDDDPNTIYRSREVILND